jgi:hypothetical protein
VPPLRNRAELLKWLDNRLTRPHDREAFDWTAPGPDRHAGDRADMAPVPR